MNEHLRYAAEKLDPDESARLLEGVEFLIGPHWYRVRGGQLVDEFGHVSMHGMGEITDVRLAESEEPGTAQRSYAEGGSGVVHTVVDVAPGVTKTVETPPIGTGAHGFGVSAHAGPPRTAAAPAPEARPEDDSIVKSET